jgi:hypothetical protein
MVQFLLQRTMNQIWADLRTQQRAPAAPSKPAPKPAPEPDPEPEPDPDPDDDVGMFDLFGD